VSKLRQNETAQEHGFRKKRELLRDCGIAAVNKLKEQGKDVNVHAVSNHPQTSRGPSHAWIYAGSDEANELLQLINDETGKSIAERDPAALTVSRQKKELEKFKAANTTLRRQREADGEKIAQLTKEIFELSTERKTE